MRRFFLLALLVGAAPLAMAAPRYTVADLGLPPDFDATQSYATAINASGQVVGYGRKNFDGSCRAFLYEHGALKPLGVLGGSGRPSSLAFGINAGGQIVGQSTTSSGDIHAFLYQNGVMTDLGVFPDAYPSAPFDNYSTATGINDAGQIVGSAGYISPDGTMEKSRGFLLDHGQLVYLGNLNEWSSFNLGINNRGQIVGASGYDLGDATPYLYSGGRLAAVPYFKKGREGFATAINSKGQIVGTMGNDDTFNHAFLSEKGRTTDLGTLGGLISHAQGVNSSGQIVGSSNLKGYAAGPHAFLYADGKMTDLTKQIPAEAGWVLNNATAINDSGQIVGNGTHSDKIRAFLLTPIPTLTVTGGRNLVTTHPRLVIRGKGDRSVRKVTYRVAPSERFKAAAGTTKWHFTARLHPGRNVIAIRATGLEGNSARTHITVTRN